MSDEYKDYESTLAHFVELHLQDGSVLKNDMDSTAAIALLKIEVAEEIGADPDNQIWLIQDNKLNDDNALENYIPPGAIHTDENPLRITVQIVKL